jgi:transcriptional antiterminator RfaH
MPILQKEPHLFPEDLLDNPHAEVSNGRRWWVLHTRPRQEKALARDLLGRRVPFYLPLIPRENVIRGKRVQSYSPVFSSYVFLYADENERGGCLRTNRVLSTLEVTNAGELVRDLRQVQRLIDLDAPLSLERRIAEQQWVRVKHGPLQGMEGIVLRRKRKTLLIILVRMLHQGVSVELDDFLVEPLT